MGGGGVWRCEEGLASAGLLYHKGGLGCNSGNLALGPFCIFEAWQAYRLRSGQHTQIYYTIMRVLYIINR
jgi:hypothetical protein